MQEAWLYFVLDNRYYLSYSLIDVQNFLNELVYTLHITNCNYMKSFVYFKNQLELIMEENKQQRSGKLYDRLFEKSNSVIYTCFKGEVSIIADCYKQI